MNVLGNVIAVIGFIGALFGWMMFLGTNRPVELVLLFFFGWVAVVLFGTWMMTL